MIDHKAMMNRVRIAIDFYDGTMVALSKETGIPYGRLEAFKCGRYRDGKSSPNSFDLASIAVATKVSPSWLLLGKGGMHVRAPKFKNVDDASIYFHFIRKGQAKIRLHAAYIASRGDLEMIATFCSIPYARAHQIVSMSGHEYPTYPEFLTLCRLFAVPQEWVLTESKPEEKEQFLNFEKACSAYRELLIAIDAIEEHEIKRWGNTRFIESSFPKMKGEMDISEFASYLSTTPQNAVRIVKKILQGESFREEKFSVRRIKSRGAKGFKYLVTSHGSTKKPRIMKIKISPPNGLVDVESIRKELASVLDRPEPGK